MRASGMWRVVGIVLLCAGLRVGEAWGAEEEGGAGARAVGGRKPNIVLIIADDLGYADLGCQGGQDVRTPSIDALAANGVRFTDAYASASVCSPSRAGLLTGRYQQKFGFEFNGAFTGFPDRGLPVRQRTIADELKSAGYATAMYGKWHVGAGPAFHPLERGFDEFFGYLRGNHNAEGDHGTTVNLLRGRQRVVERTYLTEAMTREAKGFIHRHRERPFFVCLSYHAVHAPLRAPEKYLKHFPNAEGDRRNYLGMLLAMDTSVGAVMKQIRKEKLEKETLVFFVSDNGGGEVGDNGPLRGKKHELWEGGIRVPMIVWGRGRLPAGRVVNWPASTLDVFATAVAAAGGKVKAGRADGVDLLAYFGAKAGAGVRPPERALYWRQGELAAVRVGPWKYLNLGGEEHLFDVRANPGETHERIGEQAEVAGEMRKLLKQWEKGLAAPRWPDAEE